jgi:hypothetical protein
MKARISVLVLVVGLILSGNQASAQIKSLLKDKAKNALNKGLTKGNETKQKQDTVQQQTQQQQTRKQNQQSTPNPANGFMQRKMMGMMGMNNVKYDMNYNFTSSMSMEMQNTDSLGKKSEKILYTTFFDKNSRSFAMEFEGKDQKSGQKQKSLMVFDYKNWAMLILSDNGKEKSGMAMQIARDSSLEAQQNQTQQEVKKEDLSAANMYYKATGRSKNIAGYNCKEYIYETTDGKAEIWATKEVVFDYSSAYGHMGTQAFATGGTTYGLGTTMEWHFTDLRSKAKSDMTVVDIKPTNPKSINLTGYQIIGMGGQPGQNQGKNKK